MTNYIQRSNNDNLNMIELNESRYHQLYNRDDGSKFINSTLNLVCSTTNNPIIHQLMQHAVILFLVRYKIVQFWCFQNSIDRCSYLTVGVSKYIYPNNTLASTRFLYSVLPFIFHRAVYFLLSLWNQLNNLPCSASNSQNSMTSQDYKNSCMQTCRSY